MTRFYNPFTPHWFDRSIFNHIPLDGRILNIGSGGTDIIPDIVNLDMQKLPNVDIIADAHLLPFADSSFDCVVCRAVLEHTRQPWVVSSEVQRVLRVGGIVCVESPFLEAVHDKYDYFRFTLDGLRSLFTNFKEIKSGVSGSAVQILADMLRVFPVLVVENTFLNYPMRFIMGW